MHGDFTAIDLFCGCGGLTLGLQRAGFNVRAAVDNHTAAQQTYTLNFPSVALYGADIRRLDPHKMRKDLGLKIGELDLLAACPPCQGFSRLRTRNRAHCVQDDRNDLIMDVLRFVHALKPKALMIENVPALLFDARFKGFCRQLGKSGYRYTSEILDVSDYGVAQRRQRLVVLASRVSLPNTGRKSRRRKTVRDVLGQLESPRKSLDALHAFPERRTAQVRERIRRIPKNGGSLYQLPAKWQLACHKRTVGFFDVYGRMSWDDVAPTITSGCINPSKGRFLHPVQNRTITLREAALLQGFPRNYRFDVKHGKETLALLIGNALPPPFSAVHARALRNGLIGGTTRTRLVSSCRRKV